MDYESIPDQAKAKELKQKHQAKEMLKEAEKKLHRKLKLNYRYVRTYDWQRGTTSVSFGWRQIDDAIVYSVALQSRKDHFSRKDARKHINKRFHNNQTQRFLFRSNSPIRDLGPILAVHYNSLKQVNGVQDVPDYLRHIPMYLGD